jgi:hypothetical protein
MVQKFESYVFDKKLEYFICESVKNPTFTKSVVKDLLQDIKNITPSIKRDI